MLDIMGNLKESFIKRLITSLLWFAAAVFKFLQSVDFFYALGLKKKNIREAQTFLENCKLWDLPFRSVW